MNKSSTIGQEATEAHQITFNQHISFPMTKTMQHLSYFVNIHMANLILPSKDSYDNHLKLGIKLNTLAALRNVTLHVATLFQDHDRMVKDEISWYISPLHYSLESGSCSGTPA